MKTQIQLTILVPGPGELMIISPDTSVEALSWGLWVRATGADCFEPAKHFGKAVYFCGDDGSITPICNLDLAYRFKNLQDNPNLLKFHPKAYDEFRADLGVSYFFEKENEVSE